MVAASAGHLLGRKEAQWIDAARCGKAGAGRTTGGHAFDGSAGARRLAGWSGRAVTVAAVREIVAQSKAEDRKVSGLRRFRLTLGPGGAPA